MMVHVHWCGELFVPHRTHVANPDAASPFVAPPIQKDATQIYPSVGPVLFETVRPTCGPPRLLFPSHLISSFPDQSASSPGAQAKPRFPHLSAGARRLANPSTSIRHLLPNHRASRGGCGGVAWRQDAPFSVPHPLSLVSHAALPAPPCVSISFPVIDPVGLWRNDQQPLGFVPVRNIFFLG